MPNTHASAQGRQSAQKTKQTSTVRNSVGTVGAQAAPLHLLPQFRTQSQRTPPALVQHLQRLAGNHATTRFLGRHDTAPGVQRTLQVGPVHDRYEEEAERLAAAVTGRPGAVQRRAAGVIAPQGGTLQPDMAQAIQRQRSHGRRLDPALRQPMEQHAQVDLQHVSIHTDAEADRLSRALDAKAFTVGSDLFFRRGEFNANSRQGRHLLNHELAHVVQQGGAAPGIAAQRQPVVQRYSIVNPTDHGLSPVSARANTKEIDQESGKFNYRIQTTAGAGLKLSNDKKMAVPDVPEQKEFFATQDIIDEGNTVLADQNSIVQLDATGQTIQVPGGSGPLYHVQPTSQRGASAVMGTLAVIEERCIEMAHRTAFGKGMSQSAMGMLNKSNLKANISHSDVKNMPSLGKLTDDQAQELGVNQYMMPNVGDMLATYTSIAAPGKWEYHYAAVIARSGTDYVTLENFNRMPEVTAILNQLWETLKDLDDNQEKYDEMYQTLREGYGDDADHALLHEKTVDQVIRGLNAAAVQSGQAQDVITNALNDEARMALWYFAMYGKHDQKVQTPEGEERIEDQSFHHAMVDTGDFNAPITMRLRSDQTTQGIDPRTLNIEEPPQPAGRGSKIGGFFRNKFTSTGRAEDRVKQAARALAAADVVLPADLETLESQAKGDSRTLAKARYTLQVLRLRVAMDNKSTEILGQRARIMTTPPDQVAPMIKQFGDEVDFYAEQYDKVANQTEYQKVFTGNAHTKMQAAKQRLVKSVQDLNALTHWKGDNRGGEGYQQVAKTTLGLIREQPELLDTVEYAPFLDMLEHSQFEYSVEDPEIDQSITGIYQSSQYRARMKSESARNGEEVLRTLHALKGGDMPWVLNTSRFFALLGKEEQILRACIDLMNQGGMDPTTREEVEALVAEAQFRVSLLMKAFEEAHGTIGSQILDDAGREGGEFDYYGEMGNVGAFLTNVRKRERKLNTIARDQRNQKIDFFLNLSLQQTSDYASLLEQAKLDDGASVFEELLKAQQA